MTGDEMVEKARAAFDSFCENDPEDNTLTHFIAEFARSAVRDVLAEFRPYIQHNRTCLYDISPCTCGLSALRQKFGVSE